ncbi:MAG: AMP-binding protein [Gammaproteobacteria bacterium]|nr:AMP-binding protein [Gammaproteobacteria bacterium]
MSEPSQTASSGNDNRWGLVDSQRQEDALRQRFINDPGGAHGDIASAEIHWYCPDSHAWLVRNPATNAWAGVCARRGDAINGDRAPGWRPWTRALNDSDAPFYRWFAGGLTNACFNEVDRHVLAGRGSRTAAIFEGDRWDPSKDGGRGGPVVERRIDYRELLLETVIRAEALCSLGLGKGDRVAFNLPNIPEQVFYTLAAKRLGIVYTPVFGGFSAKTLSDRIQDAGAKVIVTADGGYRNAETVAYKEAYTDAALDNYVPLATALEALQATLDRIAPGGLADRLLSHVGDALAGEISIERSDLMRELGVALAREATLPAERSAALRTAVAKRLAACRHAVEAVVVVRHTGQEVVEQARDRWSDALVAEATQRVLQKSGVQSLEALRRLDDIAYWRALNAANPALPVDADWPLFIIYTSGSTGKPKGVVHAHGGWLAGVTHTLRTVFDAKDDDRIYVIADPGWITGQAYLLAAPLSLGITTILAEGSPLFPHAGRFASTIERFGTTLFKAGSTFLKAVMTDPTSAGDLAAHDMSSLRVGTFCAEPVSPAVQAFAMDRICRHYINSYWATEHGGMVFSCPWGGYKPLDADAKTWPLPWIQAEVRIAAGAGDAGRNLPWRPAAAGEKGELVITQPYPYLARTVWGDADRLGTAEWRGDLSRFQDTYFSRWEGGLAYTQGDYARRDEDGGFTLHGRSDDVINVSGHRIGTEEIEGALLRDKLLRKDSPLGNALVVGAPHEEKGETPVAFLVAAPGRQLTDDDLSRLRQLVRDEKGASAAPSDFLVVPAFPETRSGKYLRRALRALLLDEPPGDLSTLRNPESVAGIRRAVAQWRSFGQLSDARRMFQSRRYLRVETHPLTPTTNVALLIVDSPPVNSLNERSLDEFTTVLQHLSQQRDLDAIVVTGARGVFVAGADIKQLLEVGEAGDPDGARIPPNAAHAAFSCLEDIGKPVIAAVNGPALGGGNELLLACDYVIADRHATFGQPEINLNLLPGYGGTQRLPRRLLHRCGERGLVTAARMILSGRAINADEALAAGLADEVCGDGGRSPTAVAMQRLREHFAGTGPLAAALKSRAAYLEARERPLPQAAEILDGPQLAATLAQARAGGRSRAVERIIEAITVGASRGQAEGLRREAELFAQAVCDPDSGPAGIRAFLERRSAALPIKHHAVPPRAPEALRRELEADGRLLPWGASFFPGVTPVPEYQYGLGIDRDPASGAPAHGDPVDVERLLVFKTPRPGPNEALVYVLASEINFNDIWAITGIPVSPFDARDADVQVTGSGGVALIAELGEELVREGRLSLGDLVTIYSGQSELLSPDQGLDPMAADFRIQGYERNDGSHAQFLAAQGPQLHPKPSGLSIEEAGSFGLTLGTIHRALFTTLDIQPGRRLFVEGAATGTGFDCLRYALSAGLGVVGMVSSEERAARVREQGGQALNRKEERWADVFSPVPDDAAQQADWAATGRELAEAVEELAGGPLDYVVSHAGERAFSRSFQLLGEGGALTFYGASSGYRLSFLGKPGALSPARMFAKARLRAGMNLLVIYGPGAQDGIVDPVAIEAIEAGCHLGAGVAVLTDSSSQREFVNSLGFGGSLKGVVSLEALQRRLGAEFEPPGPLAAMPDPFTKPEAFKEAVRRFSDRTLKPIGSAIAPLLRNTLDRRGLPDVVFERADRDGLALATALVKPNTGKAVYCEDLAGKRLSFHAPQVWMRQRRILMPTAEIRGTHLNTAREFVEMQERIAAGMVAVAPPVLTPMDGVAEAHQAMWENRHAGANYVAAHALPRTGLKTREELYRAWAIRDAEARGERIERVDTGSAGALR